MLPLFRAFVIKSFYIGLKPAQKFKFARLGVFGADGQDLDPLFLRVAKVEAAFIAENNLKYGFMPLAPEYLAFNRHGSRV